MSNSIPERFALPTKLQRFRTFVFNNLNFYRVHLLAFTLVPFFFSGIFYAISTNYHIAYIDCLFLCVTSMTVTGLATVDLSTLSVMQQVIMFWQMLIGSLTFVSIIMIMVRRHFFRVKFKHVVEEQRNQSFFSRTFSRVGTVGGPPLTAIRRRFSTIVRTDANGNGKPERSNGNAEPKVSPPSSFELNPVHRPTPPIGTPSPSPAPSVKKSKHKKKINKNMIVRVGGGGMGLVNPMGWYDATRETPAPSPLGGAGRDLEEEGGGGGGELGFPVTAESRKRDSVQSAGGNSNGNTAPPPRQPSSDKLVGILGLSVSPRDDAEKPRQVDETDSERAIADSPDELDPDELPPSRRAYAGQALSDDLFPRSRTIAFDDPADGNDRFPRAMTTAREGGGFPRTATIRSVETRQPNSAMFPRSVSLRPSSTRMTDTKLSGFGGFPTPFQLLQSLINRFFPKASETLTRTVTMPRTNTISGRGTMAVDGAPSKEVPYISFSAVVGRNSHFHDLTEEQMEELGGIEYRALKALLYIVAGYYIFVQLAAFVIIAPYIAAQGRYDYVFDGQSQHVSIPWFALFQAVSAFSNTGTSLVDTSMLPFQSAYLMIFVMMFLIYAGNTAFPVLLRLTVWTIYKCVPETSRLRETLKFLLDHPRRCFVYMFPSTQTWFLAFVMFCLTMIDWVCFMVLDIGTPTIMEIPVGQRIALAFFQSAAVRAAGFGIVPLASLAPAVKVLYVIMMYISVYPIALSVRSTNVYEERSLGLFNDEEGDDDLEPVSEKGAQAVAKYVGWHARRQLAFDIWWLGFALWLVCIIEKSRIDQEDTATWFNIFNIIFELVSAYGTVGLSLGFPTGNASFVASWSTLSKLVVIAVMIRGRHRGLPVAIDRAVMLPKDFTAAEEQAFEEERSRRLSRIGSSFDGGEAIFRNHSRMPSASGVGFTPLPMQREVSPRASQSHTRRRSGDAPSHREPSPHILSNSHSHSHSHGPASQRGSADGGIIANDHATGTGPGSNRPSSLAGDKTPPNRRSSSINASLGPPVHTGSPRTLSFSLTTRPSADIQRSPRAMKVAPGSGSGSGSGGGGGGSGGGALSPVREGTMSRDPTWSGN